MADGRWPMADGRWPRNDLARVVAGLRRAIPGCGWGVVWLPLVVVAPSRLLGHAAGGVVAGARVSLVSDLQGFEPGAEPAGDAQGPLAKPFDFLTLGIEFAHPSQRVRHRARLAGRGRRVIQETDQLLVRPALESFRDVVRHRLRGPLELIAQAGIPLQAPRPRESIGLDRERDGVLPDR